MARAGQQDLVVLVPGRDDQAALAGILARHEALGIRQVRATFQRHPDRDPGCLLRGHEFLRPQANRFRHALVMFDRAGCGREGRGREELEAEVESRLSTSGWGDRAAVVVINPELEIWVWADSPHVDIELGWQGRDPDLRSWLAQEGFLQADEHKPQRPKEAVEKALRLAGKRRSSAIYRQLAGRVSLQRCEDPAFLKLRDTLRGWFHV